MNTYSQICSQSLANAKYLIICFSVYQSLSTPFFLVPSHLFYSLSCDIVVVSICPNTQFWGAGGGSIKT